MRAKKSLGQNFLIDDLVVKRIIDALDISEGDRVIEIGPGTGALTSKLVESPASVIAIEFDRELISPLRARFDSYSNLELRNEDALTVDLAELVSGSSRNKLVANLPYNISTPILQRLIDRKESYTTLVLMFQKEVVERITARPGTKKRGFLTVLTEDSFAVEYLFDVPAQAFQPVPKVWSAVVRLTPKTETNTNPALFRKLVSAAFAQKRKTIQNNLKTVFVDASEALNTASIDPNRRAETLDLEEWRKLTTVISFT